MLYKHTKSLITDNIKLLLDYCERFYDRQFETRENVNLDILARFEQTLDDYLVSNLPIRKGTKERVFDANKSISEISYELGFPYPQHFSRWFKKMVGVTLNEYRQNRNN